RLDFRISGSNHGGLVRLPQLVADEAAILGETRSEVVNTRGQEVAAGAARKSWIDRVCPRLLHAPAGGVPGPRVGVDGRARITRVGHVPAVDLGARDGPGSRSVECRSRPANVDDVPVDGPAGGGAHIQDAAVRPHV